MVRLGRREKETGKPRVWVAAVVTWWRMVGPSTGDPRRRRRESLMVGPVVQPRAWRAVAAEARAASSRWPRHREMARRWGVLARRRALAKSWQSGCLRTRGRMRRMSVRSCIRVG